MSQSYFISYHKSDPGQPFSLKIQFVLRYRASEVKLKRALKRRKKIKRWAVGRRSRASRSGGEGEGKARRGTWACESKSRLHSSGGS